jgi:CHAD domain-containing protein
VIDDQEGDEPAVGHRVFELPSVHAGNPAPENWLHATREHQVVHDYDTVDRDLERLGMTISRLPSEAGVVWRLTLPRGEQVEAWEPGNAGLSPPGEIMRLIGGVVDSKELVPSAPVSADPGAARLRELLEAQRRVLLLHDPGVRLGTSPENVRRHRVAARRSRTFLRATRAYVDPNWRRSLTQPFRLLSEATGRVRDLDVLLDHLQPELQQLDEADRPGAAGLIASLTRGRDDAQRRLLEALDDESYRVLLTRLHLPPRLRAGVESIPLDRIAQREFHGLAKTVKRVGKHPPDAGLHEVRISLKRARYAAELSAPSGKAAPAFFEAARTLQRLLGEHQDAAVAESLLRSSSVVDESTAAAFVAGRIAERQVARRSRAAEQIPAAWRRLKKRGSRLYRS